MKYDKNKCRRNQKRLVGSKTFAYELTPDELDITDTDLNVTAPIQLEGVVENAGDVILLKADVKTEIERTCGRCLKVFTEPLAAQVVENFTRQEQKTLKMMLLSMNQICLI